MNLYYKICDLVQNLFFDIRQFTRYMSILMQFNRLKYVNIHSHIYIKDYLDRARNIYIHMYICIYIFIYILTFKS